MSEITNQMTATVVVRGLGEAFLNGAILVRQLGHDDLTGSVSIRPRNRMIATVNVVAPPIKGENLAPVKDATLVSSAPYLQFGKNQDLSVCETSSTICHSILGFQVPTLALEDLENLEHATLKLNLERPLEQRTTLTLYTTSNDWSESGVNWVNAPGTLEELNTITIEPGATFAQFNIFDYFYLANGSQVMDFIIKDDSGTIYTNPLSFFSRESSQPPILSYGYRWFPPSCDVATIPGSVWLPQTLDITGTLFLPTGRTYIDMPGGLEIPKFDLSDEFTGSVIISANNIADLAGTVTMNGIHLQNEFSGSLVIEQHIVEDILGSLTIAAIGPITEDIEGTIVISKLTDRYILGGLEYVAINKDAEIAGSVIIEQHRTVEVTGSLDFAAITEQTGFDGTVVLEAHRAEELPGSVFIRYDIGEGYFTGSVVIEQHVSSDLLGSVDLNAMEREAEFYGSVDIEQHVSKDLLGSIIIFTRIDSELIGSVVIRAIWGEDITGSIEIEDPNDISNGGPYAFIM